MPLTLPANTVAECLRTDCYILGDKKKKFNRSPPISVKVKNEWTYTSSVPIRLRGVDREIFTFSLVS